MISINQSIKSFTFMIIMIIIIITFCSFSKKVQLVAATEGRCARDLSKPWNDIIRIWFLYAIGLAISISKPWRTLETRQWLAKKNN